MTNSFKYTVLIVERRLTHYRIPFFEALKAELAQRNCALRFAHGSPTVEELDKKDTGELPWAIRLPTRYFWGGRLCWQPFRRHLAGVDLVVVNQENKLLNNLLLLLVPRRFKLAFWGHGANLQSDNPYGFKERFKRWTTSRVDWWFAYTSMSVELVAASGFPRSRITSVENSVDTAALHSELESIRPEELTALRQQLGFEGTRVALYLGSLYVEKRLDFLLEAADRIHAKNVSFRLLIVGDGPLRKEMSRACDMRPWCFWAGARKGREKALYLALADVMLNPGLVGLGILDSFVAGVPMVTTDCGLHSPEIAFLRQHENGVMTENTLKAFVKEVEQLLVDEKCRSRLAMGCHESAQHYTVDNMAKRFADGIVHCLKSRKLARA